MSTNQFSYCTDYDEQLLKIEHFRLHTDLLPYVGPQYDDFKILLIGESHYLPKKEDGHPLYSRQDLGNWYTEETPKPVRASRNYFITRHVVNNFLKHDRSHAHSMFHNPAVVISELVMETQGIYINDSEAYGCFAFYNYFQRPEVVFGGGFQADSEDLRVAGNITSQIIKILKPELIVFLSSFAYRSYSKYIGQPLANDIYCVSHPTSTWWNKPTKNGTSGKEEFSRLISNNLPSSKDVYKKLLDVQKEKTQVMISVLAGIEAHLSNRGTVFSRFRDEAATYYKQKESTFPCIDYPFTKNGQDFSLHIEIDWYPYFGVCSWDRENKKILAQSKLIARKEINPLEKANRYIGNYYWWDYLPSSDTSINFKHCGEDFFSLLEMQCFNENIIIKIDEFLDVI